MLATPNLAPLRALLDMLETLSPIRPSFDVLQPLLLTRQNTRAAREGYSRSILRDLTNALSKMDEAERALADFRTNLAIWRDRVAYALSPASAVPVELLRHIFDLVVSPEDGRWSAWRVSLTLSQVCSQWRSVSTAYPDLWTTLPVTTLPSLNLIPAFALRSGRRRLHLKLGIPNFRGRAPAFPMTLDAPVASQLRVLTVAAQQASRSLILSDGSAEVLQLQSVVIDHPGEIFFDDLVAHATSLTLVRCTFKPESTDFDGRELAQLERLSFDQTPLTTIDNFRPMVLTKLKTLILRHILGAFGRAPIRPDPTGFCMIETLTLEKCSPSVLSWGTSLKLPKLRMLTVSLNGRDMPLNTALYLEDFLEGAGLSVTTLRLAVSVKDVLAVAGLFTQPWDGEWMCPSVSSFSLAWDLFTDLESGNVTDTVVEDHLVPITTQLSSLLAPCLERDPSLQRTTFDQLCISECFVDLKDEHVRKDWFQARVPDFVVLAGNASSTWFE